MNHQSKTFNSVRNIVFGIGSQAVSLMLSIVNRVIFIHTLGVGVLGINGLFADVLTMLSLADLGLGTAMTYSFYKPLAENDVEKISALLTFYRKIYHIIAATISCIGISLIPFLKFIINLDQEIPFLYGYYILFLANTVVSYLFAYKSSIIYADQRSYMLSIYSTVISLLRLALQSISLILWKNYIIYLLIQIVATLANNICIAYKTNHLYPFVQYDQKLDKSEKKSIFKNIYSIFLYKISSVLINGTDNILISTLIDTVWVGIYSNYSMVITAVNGFINTLFSSLNASVGKMMVQDTPEKKYQVFQIMQMMSFCVGGFAFVCFYFLTNDLIALVFGETYVVDRLILTAIILNFYLGCALQPLWSYREASGLYVRTKYVMLITAVINIILSIILGMQMGLSGILFASAISRLLTYFWYEPYLLFKIYFQKKAFLYYLEHLKYAGILLCLIFALSLVFELIPGVSWRILILKFVICSLVSITVYLLINIRSKEYRMLKKRVKSFFMHFLQK